MMTPPWDSQRQDAAIARGPHQSARDHADFVREEFADFMNKKFWTILPYRLVKRLRGLRLSPLGVVPQRERRPRLIVDLSFYDVNQECLPIAPSEAMQFGKALKRLLQKILAADPRYGPVYISKIDISDGFYRIRVAPRDVPKLGVLLPMRQAEEPMVAFPLALPMGWVNSPPYFTAVTETAADVMNRRLRRRNRDTKLQPHRLEEHALFSTNSETDTTGPAKPHRVQAPRLRLPLRYTDVYVDDFVALLQGNVDAQAQAMRVLLYTLDEFFRPLESEEKHRQEPSSVKKLKKGDARWSTRKVVLGWLVDTIAGTIELPMHRRERLHEILDSIPATKKRCGVQAWQKVLGELRSMVLAIPGARGLFSTLQEALRPARGNKVPRVRLTSAVHQFLQDFRTLSNSLSTRPTRIAELFPGPPSIIGATDASGQGMGGVAFANQSSGLVAPILWRQKFGTKIQRNLASFENPKGPVTNSDLELAATVVHHDVVSHQWDVAEHTVHTFHDNTPAVYWQRKGSTTTVGPAAYLLRLQSHHQRHHRYVPRHDYLPARTLAAAPRPQIDEFRRDLRISETTVRRGVVPGTQAKADNHWAMWTAFATELRVDPLLTGISDPIPLLQVFATRYRRRLGPTGQPVKSGTVSDAVRSVGQTMASMGARDLRKDSTGALDFRLSRMFKAFTREDPPPQRVKPIPVAILREVATASMHGDEHTQAVADMIILGFFFLLRPGEYTGTDNDDTPFRIQDTQLFLGERRLDLHTTPEAVLANATSVSLTFTTQKNGVRGEVVNHGRSFHPILCPVRATLRRVLHLRHHQAHPATILASYFSRRALRQVTARDVTMTLRAATLRVGPATGFLPADVSARSLRAGGAMALFNSAVDQDTIQLLGRWRSDAMLRYLHLQARPVMRGFAQRMLQGGDYELHPNQEVQLVPLY